MQLQLMKGNKHYVEMPQMRTLVPQREPEPLLWKGSDNC